MDKINQVITQLIPHATEFEIGVAETAEVYQFKDGIFVVHLRVGLLGCKTVAWDLEKSTNSIFISCWDDDELNETGKKLFGKGVKHSAGMSKEDALRKWIKFRDELDHESQI